MSSANPFAPLDYGRDDIFRELEPYLTREGLGTMLLTLQECLVNNNTPTQRLIAVTQRISPSQFVSGPMTETDRLYKAIRAAFGKYDVDCSTSLPNGSPVWKKLVILLWPAKFDDVCASVKSGASTRSANEQRKHYA